MLVFCFGLNSTHYLLTANALSGINSDAIDSSHTFVKYENSMKDEIKGVSNILNHENTSNSDSCEYFIALIQKGIDNYNQKIKEILDKSELTEADKDRIKLLTFEAQQWYETVASLAKTYCQDIHPFPPRP